MILVDKSCKKKLYNDLKKYFHEDVVYPLQDIKIKDKVFERVPIHDYKIKKFCWRHKAILVTSDWKMHFDAPNWGIRSILIPRFGNPRDVDFYDLPTKMKILRVLQKLESKYFRLWQIGINIPQVYFDITYMPKNFKCKYPLGKRKYIDPFW